MKLTFEPNHCIARIIWRGKCALILFATFMMGCDSQPLNPSFPTNPTAARADLGRMESRPRGLKRPLVVVGGFADPGVASWWLKREFETLTGDRRIIAVPLGECASIDQCGQRIVEAVETAFPSGSSKQTCEVDVVGYSLGGVASRYAGAGWGRGKRLRIARLFAISAPMRGARVAQEFPLFHPIQWDLRPGSLMLTSLNASKPDYLIYSYVCLGDTVIGEANAALPGRTPWWVPRASPADAHSGAFFDPRIVADIARRLRDEPAFAQDPPAQLPGSGENRS